jgi:EmrB/QacA subfamily drug resistance transporter
VRCDCARKRRLALASLVIHGRIEELMERKWWTLIAVSIATFMLLIDVTIVNVALPDIQKSLHSNFSDLQWVVDAYALMLAALLLVTGSLADLFGRRRVFVLGLVVFTVSSLLSGLATTPLFLNLARGAQGVGGAAMFSTSLALLANSFRGPERGVAFGVWGTITGLAVAIGPVVGGALTTGLGWRWIFLVNVPIGVIGVLLTLLRVEESRQPGAHRPDWIGALTFSGALAALIYALIKGNTLGWSSDEIRACLGGAGGLLLVFLIAELVQRAPMFDLALFRKPTFTGGALVAFSLSAGMFSLLLYLTLYLQDVLGFSALDTGLRLLVLSGGILLTSTIAGRLTARVSIRLLIAPGLAMVGGGLLLMRGLTPASDWTHFVPGFILAGAGVGFINPPLASTAVGVVEPARAGMASGINSTFRQIGIATGIAGFGAIFSHTVSSRISDLLDVVAGVSPAQAASIASAVSQGGGAGPALAAAPPQARADAIYAVRVGYVDGLNKIFLIAAILIFATALLSFLLIRQKDFEASAAHRPVAADDAAPALAPAAAAVAVPDVSRPIEEAVAEPAGGEVPAPSVAASEVVAPPSVAEGVSADADPTPTPVAVAEGVPADADPTPTPTPVAEGVPADADPTPTPTPTPVAERAVATEADRTPVAAGGARAVAADADHKPEAAWLVELAGPSHAVAVAAEQATADCTRAIERSIDDARRRAEAEWHAGAGWSPLVDGRAAALRTRLGDLGDERRRLVASLAEQTQAINAHARAALEHTQEAGRRGEDAAATRRELYGLIAALSALADEAAVAAGGDVGRSRGAGGDGPALPGGDAQGNGDQ